jgi:hypothetical protein
MIPRIRELLHTVPFQAFTIRTSDGREYSVPTADHAAVHPRGTYLLVFGDDESTAKISALHVAALVESNGNIERP